MTDLDFEQRLRAGFRGAVDAVAPPALRATVNAIPETVGTVERRGWTAGWGFPRMNRFALALAATAAVVTLAIGIGLLLQPPNVGPSPVPVVPTATPASPAPTEKGLPAQAGQFAQPCDFGLTPGGVGWVSTPAALYRTENLGRTWSVVSPPGWSDAPKGQSVNPYVTSLFADADTAYTYLPGTPGTIAVTHDGGANWAEQAVAGTTANDGAALWFQTPTSGSLIFWAANKGDPSRVFTTADGGGAWTGPRRGPSMDNADGVGDYCDHNVLNSVAVRTVTPPGDLSMANKLQVSHDAGATWIDRTLPVGPQAPASGPSQLVDKTVITAWGDGSGRIVMALEVSGGPGPQHQIYTSLDDGRSWQYVQTQTPLRIGNNSQFLSATEWILVAPDASTFMSTTDGGATWRTVTGAVRFWISYNPNNVSFASPDFGWIRPSCNDPMTREPRASVCTKNDTRNWVLLQTTDGGATWTPLDKQP